MEEVLQRFTAWFIKFAVVSFIVLLSTHLIARSIRSKKKQKKESPDQTSTETVEKTEATSSEETS
ncbi:hypothetical protein Mal48_20020 [Thalassoglobus polymorphus]|uniref:Uncharacterized protein n=1 Tax=Thalassoglobus polymorphus TaxID=2527994 RepID=A0A517QMC6_9PLAN|nr:hypothetical protein Mal48_20020 [Thalassoglobus polymorphus]